MGAIMSMPEDKTAPSNSIVILSSRDLQTVMRFDDYVDAVGEDSRLLAEGRCESPVPMQINVADGTFHAKAASLPRGPGYVAVKVNGNFPGQPFADRAAAHSRHRFPLHTRARQGQTLCGSRQEVSR
jgi:hypothetical protein